MQVIYILKLLTWKSCDFLTNPTIKTAIDQNFYLSKFLLIKFLFLKF